MAAEEPRRVLRHVLAVRRAVQLLLLLADAGAGRAVRLRAVASRAAERLLALALLALLQLLRLDGGRAGRAGLTLLAGLLRLTALLLLRRARVALLLLLLLGLLLLRLLLVVAVELRLKRRVVGRDLVAVAAIRLVRVVVGHAAVERVLGGELLLLLLLGLSRTGGGRRLRRLRRRGRVLGAVRERRRCLVRKLAVRVVEALRATRRERVSRCSGTT